MFDIVGCQQSDSNAQNEQSDKQKAGINIHAAAGSLDGRGIKLCHGRFLSVSGLIPRLSGRCSLAHFNQTPAAVFEGYFAGGPVDID